MNAKEQNIDVTVVCELKLKTEPQLSDKKIKAYFLTAGNWKLTAILQLFSYKAASVHLLLSQRKKQRQNKREKKPTLFYINNKNLVTKIIKPNPGQSLLL